MILIKFASRARPEKFRSAIANIVNTIQTDDYLIFVSADIDDPKMNNPKILDFCNQHEGKIVIVHGESKSKVDAINRDMDLAQNWPWEILINFSDDMQFVKSGWDNILKKRIKDTWGCSGKFFAHFNDGNVGDALSTMSIMGREYYELDNYIYHPSYKSFSCDAESYFVSIARGMHKYFDDIIFRHHHPAYSNINPYDELYRVNSLATEHDTKNYFERLNNDFELLKEGYTGPFVWDKFKTK